jgi:hypothetical protein
METIPNETSLQIEKKVLKKEANLKAQKIFRQKHPYYNSFMCYKRKRKKKNLPIEFTYMEWCEDKMQQKTRGVI